MKTRLSLRGVPEKLQHRLLLLVVIALLPSFALLLWTAARERSRSMVAVEDSALQLARVASRDEELLVASTRQLLDVLAQLAELRNGDSRTCDQLLAKLLSRYPQYLNLGVAELDGDVICSGLPPTGLVSIADRPYFLRALTTGGFASGDYQIGRITGRASINFGYPVLDTSGRPQGVVFAALGLDWLNELARQIELPEGTSLTVVDRGGTVLADTLAPERRVGESLGVPALIKRFSSDGEDTARAQLADGVVRIIALRPLEGSGTHGRVFLLVGIPESTALEPLQRNFVMRLALLAMIAAFTIALVWVGSEVMIVGPVRLMVEASRELGRGHLDIRVGSQRYRGELRELALAFDDMAASLQQSVQELKELNRDLEGKVEERAAELKSILVRAERTQTIAELSRRFAHEILNPLGALANTIYFMRSPPEEGGLGNDRRVRAMERETMRIERLVRNLLTYTEPPRPVWSEVDLNRVVSETLEEAQIPPDINVSLDLGTLPKVMGDPTHLRQALLNLTSNAVEAMPQGGTLTAASRTEGDKAVIEVRDTGVGISAENLPRVFDALFSTKSAGGFGLGLASVRSIAEAHRGSVSVESAEGKGSIFRIALPLQAAPDPSGVSSG